MAKIDVLDILRAKKQSPAEFEFDNLWIPPIWNYLTPQDIERLRSIATSVRLSSKIELKYKMIDDIMRPRGFKRFSAGTNRIVYSFLEDTRFLVKIAVDKVGMQDNPMEYQTQFLLKPYVTKMFYISPCGTVGFSERVLPIKNKAEFREIAEDVFEILVNKILGEYVVEDVGTKYFMNWGIRAGFGPVLLDSPYVYKLDGKKLFCTKEDPITHMPCNGEIDYDAGFNHLVCARCGKIYLATDLKDNDNTNKIIIKGGSEMKVSIKRGDEVIYSSISTKEVIEKPTSPKTSGLIKVSIGGGSKSVAEEKKISNESDIKATIGKKDESSNIQPNRAANGRFVSKNTNKNTAKTTSSPKKVEAKTVVEEAKEETAQEFIFEDDTKVDDEVEVAVPEVATDVATAEETNLDFEVDEDDSEEDDTSDAEESNSGTFSSDDTDDYSMYDDDEMFAGTRTPIRRSNKRSSDGEGSRSSSYKKGSSSKVSKKK